VGAATSINRGNFKSAILLNLVTLKRRGVANKEGEEATRHRVQIFRFAKKKGGKKKKKKKGPNYTGSIVRLPLTQGEKKGEEGTGKDPFAPMISISIMRLQKKKKGGKPREQGVRLRFFPPPALKER